MATIKAQTLKGFRDFEPREARKRQYVISRLRSVFESYGFEPLETPALEYEEVLLGKYGGEGDKLMYRFEDQGKRKVAMRYDQTVPLARYVAQNYQSITFPFKRYQIQSVWRAENTQKGRYREFLQCDVDTVGTASSASDAEIISVVYKSLIELGFKEPRILINTKSLLYSIFESAKIPKEKWNEIAMSLDKLGKVGEDKVLRGIIEKKGVEKGSLDALFETSQLLQKNYPDARLVTEGNLIKMRFEVLNKELAALKDISIQSKRLGVPPTLLIPRFTLARGLEYYTGMIIEAEIEGYSAGAVGGGGRYDNLIGMFAGKQIPAVGFAFGFDRVIEAMEEQRLFPQELNESATKALVTVFPDYEKQSMELVSKLRNAGINAELYLEEAKLDKQLKYADRKKILYVVVLGPDEVKENVVTVKTLKTGEQEKLTIEQLISKLSS